MVKVIVAFLALALVALLMTRDIVDVAFLLTVVAGGVGFAAFVVELAKIFSGD